MVYNCTSYKLIYLDELFEMEYARCSIKDFVAQNGWEKFRKEKARVFKEVIEKYGGD